MIPSGEEHDGGDLISQCNQFLLTICGVKHYRRNIIDIIVDLEPISFKFSLINNYEVYVQSVSSLGVGKTSMSKMFTLIWKTL